MKEDTEEGPGSGSVKVIYHCTGLSLNLLKSLVR